MIAVIDCCGSNIASVKYALQRVGVDAVFTSDSDVVNKADKVILPGVGSAEHAMNKLQQNNLVDVIQNLQQPVLGVCLGMQLLFEGSEEGDVQCLGVISEKIMRFPVVENITVPHMGWNTLSDSAKDSQLMHKVSNDYVYFVHSYYAPVCDFTVAKTTHGIQFSSVVNKKNFYGMQFHPEKSGKVGEQLLHNFIELKNWS